jgi:hypothetical protein
VAIGPVHFVSHGRIAQVCGNEVKRLYFRPYEVDPRWGLDPDARQGEAVSGDQCDEGNAPFMKRAFCSKAVAMTFGARRISSLR